MSLEALLAVSFLTPPVTVALSLLDAWKDISRPALYLVGLFVTMVLVEGLKELFMIPRPSASLIPETGYSFPSGHAALGFYPLGFYATRSNRLRGALFVYGAIAAYSRLGLGVHRPVDVVAGGLLALITGYVVAMQMDDFGDMWTRLENRFLG